MRSSCSPTPPAASAGAVLVLCQIVYCTMSARAASSARSKCCSFTAVLYAFPMSKSGRRRQQQSLNFFPEAHGQGSLHFGFHLRRLGIPTHHPFASLLHDIRPLPDVFYALLALWTLSFSTHSSATAIPNTTFPNQRKSQIRLRTSGGSRDRTSLRR